MGKSGVWASVPDHYRFTIEFYADCQTLEIKSLLSCYYVIEADGVRIDSSQIYTGYPPVIGYTPIKFAEKKKRHIKIYYYGWSFMGVVADGEVTKYKKKRLLLCGDGDSVVAGHMGAEGMHTNWLSVVGHILDMDISNAGVGGSGFIATGNGGEANMPDRFDNKIAKINPDVLIFSGGFNDRYKDTATFRTQVDAYFQKTKELSNCKVVACSPYCNVATPTTKLNQLCEILRKKALEYHVPFIDYMHAMTYDADGNCITNNLGTEAYHNVITEENISTYVSSDSVHPTTAGHRAMGKYIAHELYKVLNRLEGF